jgi:hypothetical protein
MYPLIDLAAGTIVRRNDQCSGGRLCILSRNGPDTFLVSLYLMHTTLLVKAFYCGSNMAACKLLDNLFQLWITLANDVIQSGRPHTGFLQLRERTASFNGLMLAAISDQQHRAPPPGADVLLDSGSWMLGLLCLLTLRSEVQMSPGRI